MNNKSNNILIVLSVILVSALCVMAMFAERHGYKNLLLVTPSTFGSPGQNQEKLEEFSEEELLMTYEIRRPSTAQAINSKHPVTFVGTNQNYSNIMGYVALDGGFFTKAAWDAKNKHAVLNETAAFQIFGSNRITGQTLKLNGESWIVTGVIQDNDAENAIIYAPSSVTGGQAESLMALMDDRDVTETYVKNALKSIGILENNYDFINLSKSASAFDERFSVGWKAMLFVVILLFAFKSGRWIIQSLRLYSKRMREIYFRELLVYHGADFIKTISGLLIFTTCIIGIFFIAIEILETCLTWQEIVPITGELAAGDFGGKLAWLRDYYWIDIALFTACIGVSLLYFCLALRQKTREPKEQAKILYGKSKFASITKSYMI